MPLYFFHLRDNADVALDPEGKEMPAEAVDRMALRSARDCMAGEIKSGQLDLRYRIDVHDERGALVHRLRFADAVRVITAA